MQFPVSLHSWHSWDPQEFASFGSGRGERTGPCRGAAPGTRRAGRTGGKGSGRGLGRKSGNRKPGGPGIAPPCCAAAQLAGRPADTNAERSRAMAKAGGVLRGHLLSQRRERPSEFSGRKSLGKRQVLQTNLGLFPSGIQSKKQKQTKTPLFYVFGRVLGSWFSFLSRNALSLFPVATVLRL